MKSNLFKIFAIMMVLAMVVSPASAQTPTPTGNVTWEKGLGDPEPAELAWVQSFSKADSFIVLLEEPSLASLEGEISGFGTIERTDDGKLELDSPAAVSYLRFLKAEQDSFIKNAETTLGRKLAIEFRYDVILNGFSAKMSPEEAAQLLTLPGVRGVYPNELWQINTDVSPGFLGADTIWDGTSTPAGITADGEGLIAGILDTGINMDHPSFADIAGDGYDHTNPRGTGVYLGLCASDPTNYVCNDKLIGVYAYTQAYETVYGEDTHAHGSHTASTTAGNVLDVDYYGNALTISGMAPRANIIAYDVCYEDGCPNAASLAAVNQAILDGVDVLNYSIGPNSAVNPYENPVELAMLDAMHAGILTATSAGNSGPGASTVYKAPPWSVVVANSTHGRIFGYPVEVFEPSGVPFEAVALPGVGVPFSMDMLDYPIRWAGDDDAGNFEGCDPFTSNFFDGSIALISRGTCAFADKINNAAAAGAEGVLVYNNAGGPPIVMGGIETTTIPSAMLDKEDGDAIVALMSDTLLTSVFASQEAAFKTIWSDILASGSSRGPYALLDILEPEVAAPGTNILAAYNTPGETAPFGGVYSSYEIDLMSGTSMASPHVAGSILLMKELFPAWSPMQIKSALTMSAFDDNMLKDNGVTPTDAFDDGNGRLDLTIAGLVGLTMDETRDNFLAADPAEGGDVKTLNIPSYQNSQCVGACSFTRTFTAVADGSYTAVAVAPVGVEITVTPSTFDILAGDTQEVLFEIDVMGAEIGTWQFASVTFDTSDFHGTGEAITDVRIPLAVLPDAGNMPALVEKNVYRDAGGTVVEDLYAIEITDLTIKQSGLTEAELFDFELPVDPTNGDPFDDLGDVWYTTFDIPANTKRVVLEILETSASDLDLFFGYGPVPSEATLWDAAATGAALEYLSWVDPIEYEWWVLVQNWGGTTTPDDVTLAVAVVPDVPSTNFDVTGPDSVPALDLFDMEVTWNVPEMEPLSAWYGWFSVGSDSANAGNIGQTEVNLYRRYDDVTKEVSADYADEDEVLTYTITVAPNRTGTDLHYVIDDVLPEGVTYVTDSLETTGSFIPATFDEIDNSINWEGTMPKIEYTYIVSDNTINPTYCDTPWGGYLDIYTEFGYPSLAGLAGDSVHWAFTSLGLGTQYYGAPIPSTPRFTSDGYTYMYGTMDYWWNWVIQDFPDPITPNGIVAEWMRDTVIVYDAATNKGVTGVAFGSGAFWVVEFDDIEDYEDPNLKMDYQIWGVRDADPTVGYPDLVIAYDNVVGSWDNLGAVGLENIDATLGSKYAYNDWAPASGDIVCFDYAEAGAEPVVITFDVTVDSGLTLGDTITNVVNHTADGFGMLEEMTSAAFMLDDQPFADDQNLSTLEETALDITLTASDTYPGGALTWMVNEPAHGTLTGTAPEITYTPDEDFYGMDSFTFTVSDGMRTSEEATMTIEVINVNDAPEAMDDSFETLQDVVLDVPAPGVLANDVDVDPTDAIFVDVKDEPMHGTLVLNQDGSFTYTPDANFFGVDSFTYYMLGIPMPTSEYADWATVTITVHPAVKIYFPLIFK